MKWTKSSKHCSDEAAYERSVTIDVQLEREGRGKDKMFDILLFEPEESKTAEDFLKQVSILHSGGFNVSERRAFTGMVLLCILEKMRLVLEAVSSLQLSLKKDNQVHSDCILSLDSLSSDVATLPGNIFDALRSLVEDSAVSEAFDRAAESQLEPMDADSARYFFSAVERIADPAYLPTNQDILRARPTIAGNQATILKIGETTYRLCNMSNQWHGRRKWIHHFEGMKAVLFFVDLNMYDYDPEESTSNYIEDAIDMFDVLCNTGSFEDSSKILFLFTDGFEEKLIRVPLANYFPDYSGQSHDAACDYILHRFVSVKRSQSKAPIYAHYSSKTDTQQVKFMLSAIQDILLQIYLRDQKLIT